MSRSKAKKKRDLLYNSLFLKWHIRSNMMLLAVRAVERSGYAAEEESGR